MSDIKSRIMERILNRRLSEMLDQRVTIAGWVHNVRRLGQVNFLLVRDRSGIAQAVLGQDDLAPLNQLQRETVIELSGTVREGPTELGVELHDVTITVLSPVTETLPFELAKKELRVSLPTFLDHAAVGLRHPRQRSVMTLASGLMSGFRRALRRRDFVEIQSPKLVASATESGANVFEVNYFGRTAYLAQSPQFYKQIMVGVHERVFEVGPVFRAEPHSTSRHLNEYVSLDLEMGFIRDHFDVMALLNDLLIDMMAYLKTDCSVELEQLSLELPPVPNQIPWVYFPEAQRLLETKLGHRDASGEPDLSPAHERALGTWANDQYGSDFLFVTGYPMVKRPFYTHSNPGEPEYSNGFDLLFRGQELVTGGQRLHRYEDYLKAAQLYGYSQEQIGEYLDAFRFGMPPHGGFGMGLERFLAGLLRANNIQEVTLFPRDMKRLRP